MRARTDNYPVLVTSDKKCQTLARDDREPLHRSRKTNKTNGMTACPFPDRHLGPADWITTVRHSLRIASQLRTRGRCLDCTVFVSYHFLKERIVSVTLLSFSCYFRECDAIARNYVN